MKVQIVTPYRVSHLQRYGVTVRGNVTSVYVVCYVTDYASWLETLMFSCRLSLPGLDDLCLPAGEGSHLVIGRSIGRKTSYLVVWGVID
jgi:hypothetical protein